MPGTAFPWLPQTSLLYQIEISPVPGPLLLLPPLPWQPLAQEESPRPGLCSLAQTHALPSPVVLVLWFPLNAEILPTHSLCLSLDHLVLDFGANIPHNFDSFTPLLLIQLHNHKFTFQPWQPYSHYFSLYVHCPVLPLLLDRARYKS